MVHSDDEDTDNEERVTAESYGALDTSQVADDCWLIRVPQKLAELWEKAPEGTDLGELIFTKGGGKYNTKPSLEMQVAYESVVADEPGGPPRTGPPGTMKRKPTIPLHYSLQAMTKKVPVLHPFVRNPNNGSVRLLGTVSRTANLQVEHQDSSYRALLKDRLVATNVTSNRFVKPVDAAESVIAKQRSATAALTTKKHGFSDAVYQCGKRLLEAKQESSLLHQQQQLLQGGTKKGRQFAPDQPIKSVLFELFGQKQFWTVKDLKAAAVAGGATSAGTKRAETEIRDVLREIGEYHRSGDHKNMWELRKEFQQQA